MTLAPATLHPAARRRLQNLLPPAETHDVALRPVGGGDGRAMIVTATEPSFVEAVLADLSADDWRTRLAARRGVRRGAGGVLELGQPTHRRFHLVVLEAVCQTPGRPPIDPARLAGMGLVLRRIENDGTRSGWMKAGAVLRGWLPITVAELDPDPATRLQTRPGAAGQIAAMIAARRGGEVLAEEMLPLFVAPPAVCAARGRTIIYGIVPVASSERAATTDVPDFNNLPADEAGAMADHLSGYLKARPLLAMPRPGTPLDPRWAVLQAPAAGDVDADRLHVLGVFLHQLMVELGAFGSGSAASALMAELAAITLPMERDQDNKVTRTMPASDFVRTAAAVLIGGEANGGGLTMPLEWPAIDAGRGARLTTAALACLTQRYRQVVAETPKFDRDDNRYAVRAFVRVKGHDACPPKLVWSDDFSEPFRIVPWWDGDGPATRVALPSLSQLRAAKPGVTFELPPALANLLNSDMKKLKDGDGSAPSELGIGWLCSFSIPIITICAFIILNIFLSLFDIIFFWMAYLKICIPYPKKK
jgi:hypothetical protein